MIYDKPFPKKTPSMTAEEYHNIVMAERQRRLRILSLRAKHRRISEQELFEQRVRYWHRVLCGEIPQGDSIEPIEKEVKPRNTVIIKQYVTTTQQIKRTTEGLEI